MKGMKERLVKKLRLITLKQGLTFSHNPKQVQDDKHNDLLHAKFHSQRDEKPEAIGDEIQDGPEHEGEIFSEFEEKCPPGGEDSVVFYTTSLRGVRKTFEDCRRTRFLLENHSIYFRVRDVSMDLGLREEMWRLLGKKVTPPRLFIRGRYIGGADEAVILNENGKLKKLLEGIQCARSPCEECEGEGFLICSCCNGSSRVLVEEEGHATWRRCSECNENGLLKCPLCY